MPGRLPRSLPSANPLGGLTPADVPLIEAEILSERPGPPLKFQQRMKLRYGHGMVNAGVVNVCVSIFCAPLFAHLLPFFARIPLFQNPPVLWRIRHKKSG